MLILWKSLIFGSNQVQLWAMLKTGVWCLCFLFNCSPPSVSFLRTLVRAVWFHLSLMAFARSDFQINPHSQVAGGVDFGGHSSASCHVSSSCLSNAISFCTHTAIFSYTLDFQALCPPWVLKISQWELPFLWLSWKQPFSRTREQRTQPAGRGLGLRHCHGRLSVLPRAERKHCILGSGVFPSQGCGRMCLMV